MWKRLTRKNGCAAEENVSGEFPAESRVGFVVFEEIDIEKASVCAVDRSLIAIVTLLVSVG